jgi:hypothetical protein
MLGLFAMYIYPLPLIGRIINHLQRKTVFTKMDLQWGFNNIWVKEEDQWKAAFKTPFGLHKPVAMPFGVCNTPSTFCRAMSRMSKHLTDKYPTELFIYVNNILVATGNDLRKTLTNSPSMMYSIYSKQNHISSTHLSACLNSQA